MHSSISLKGTASRRLTKLIPVIVLLAMAFVLSFSFAGPVGAQSAPRGGLGVGNGHGLEIGINVDRLNQLRAEVAAGVYDRPCTAAEHDPNAWHTLVNTQARCHYDHMHGDDPNYVNDIFGAPGAWFGAPTQEISYPWQTFKLYSTTDPYQSSAPALARGEMENQLKHEGYLWIVRRDQPCPNGNCVRDFRLQTHAIFGAHDMPVRYHSFSLEMRLCRNGNDLSSCGIVRYGGWADLGRLFTTAPGNIDCGHGVAAQFISTAQDTLFFPIDRPASRDEIRCHPMITNLPAYPSPRPLSEWWGHGAGESRFQVRMYDPIGNVDPANPANWHFYCGQTDMNCKYDGSIMTVWMGYQQKIHNTTSGTTGRPLDSDRDGRTDYRGYFNRWGGPNYTCSSVSLDCIPFYYDNVPFNLFNNTEAAYVQTICETCPKVDHDISKAGQRWITWFYRYAGNHSTETPMPLSPTATPVSPTATPTVPQVTPSAQPPTSTPVPPTATVNPTVATLRVELDKTTANVGETVTAALNLYNVQNLYGLQAQCVVNPAVLGGTTRTDGTIFTAANSFFVDSGFKTDGHWLIASSLLKPNPAFSGNGTAFRLSYNVLAAGTSAIDCSIIAADINGNPITLTVVNTSFNGNGSQPTPTTPPVTPTTVPPTPTTVPPTATPVTPTAAPTMTPSPIGPTATAPANGGIVGIYRFQNRPTNAGIAVTLILLNQPVVTVMTDADGKFAFTDVPPGDYVVQASATSHLTILQDVTVTAGPATDLGSHTLPAGDTDGDNAINVSDAGLIGANFGIDVPPAPTAADLNGDAKIDIRDLVLVGSNFGLTGPIVNP